MEIEIMVEEEMINLEEEEKGNTMATEVPDSF